MIGATVTRSKTLSERLAAHDRLLAERVRRGLVLTGEKLLDMSDALVPKDTHALVGSGVARTEGSGFDTLVVVGYGRYGDVVVEYSEHEGRIVTRRPEEYATIVHQGLGPPTVTGESEFLLKPVLNGQDELRQVFNTEMFR